MSGVNVQGTWKFEGDKVSFVFHGIDSEGVDFSAINSVPQLKAVLTQICRIGYEIGLLTLKGDLNPAKPEPGSVPDLMEEAKRQYAAATKRAEEQVRKSSEDAMRIIGGVNNG